MAADRGYLKDLKVLRKSRTRFPDSPARARLETFGNRYPHRDFWITFDCPEFTSLCPVTGQPDFGHLSIRYIPARRCVESKSLKLYLFSYRNFPTFYEEAVNRILDDFVRACAPRECVVDGVFTPRGGIGIKVTASHRQGA